MTTHLKAHQGIHRTTNKTHSCPACPMTFNKLAKLAEHMETIHNMKMETPNRSNRVQLKSHTSKNDTVSDNTSNVLVSEVELVPNYPNTETNFISMMEIKNEFRGNIQ